jgi:hypothetical protein
LTAAAERSTLAKQIPTLVEGHLDLTEALDAAVRRRRVSARAAQAVLLVNEAADVPDDVGVIHRGSPGFESAPNCGGPGDGCRAGLQDRARRRFVTGASVQRQSPIRARLMSFCQSANTARPGVAK